ncbi:hypothetical protein Cgig2_024018 [Carnegiea gigantea]|uniref:carnosine N-methyltransferase n=1 Tax=Carnegiea gigantea TaxID=171969 RepID=A0A9Q1JR61_9CARY|nr:hypothetical protein Cgig2_024018 [Carnegiea gigantea]
MINPIIAINVVSVLFFWLSAPKLLVSGLYTLGSIAIAILFPTKTNFVQFLFQTFFQLVCKSGSESSKRYLGILNSAGITDGFSMCGGDFVEVYGDPSQAGTWDAVVTCFFIDTAHNIVEYIEIIWKILKDGGDLSIELSLEDVKKVAFHYGFSLERECTIATTYTTNIRSMMQNRYFAAFWTMAKRTGDGPEEHNAE